MDQSRPVVSPSNQWDEKTRTRFKGKFYRLTIQLNAIVLCVAIAGICLFLPLIPASYRFPLIAGCLVIAAVLLVNFVKKYRETKAWLDVHGKKKADNDQQ